MLYLEFKAISHFPTAIIIIYGDQDNLQKKKIVYFDFKFQMDKWQQLAGMTAGTGSCKLTS